MILIEHPSIDDATFEGNPVLRGVIHQDSLPLLRIDGAYQREFLSPTSRRFLMDALSKEQRLPDMELGMRGDKWSFKKNDNNIVQLHDNVFIIDGQQRRGSLLEYLERFPGKTVRQGALIHFNTTMEWERERFHALNLHQVRVGAGILLRNLRSTNGGVATLYGLTMSEKSFPLFNRVCWQHARLAKDLLSATAFGNATLLFHGHLGSGIVGTGPKLIGYGADRLVGIIGLAILRANTEEFWGVIERIWGIKDLTSIGAPWLTSSFLRAFANVVSDHTNFWHPDDSKKLKFPPEIIKRLESFPINDPEIRMLARSGGAAQRTLQYHLITHINKYLHSPLARRDVERLVYENRAAGARAMRKAQAGKPKSRPKPQIAAVN